MIMDAAALCRRLDQLKQARGTFDTHWQRVADYMLPSREFTRKTIAGGARTANLIFDTTPVLALEQLAGALHGMLTSPALRWFALRPNDSAMLDDSEVRKWFEAATDALYAVFTGSDAGFDTALHEVYLDLAGMGNGILYGPDRGRRGPGFQARPLNECFFAENAEGKIDTVFRSYTMPAREVVRLWEKAVPREVGERAEKEPDAPLDILHGVYPDYAKKGWHECYALTAQKVTLETGKYETFPYATPRWMKRSGEIYGSGPGMSVLPSVRLLNKTHELMLRGVARAVDPTILLPDDGFLSSLTTKPGGALYFRANAMGMDRIQALPSGQPQVAYQLIEMVQKTVRAGFYTDWMNLPQQPNMTATEVLQRRDEMLRLLGPMVARVTQELLSPVITRTFHVMAVNGMFPALPEKLKGHGWQPEYLSPLATAQRASDAEAVMRWFGALAQLAQVDPTVVSVVATEEAARYLATRFNAPASVVRSSEQMQALREQQAQAQEQQREMAAAQAAAKVANDGAGALASLAGAQTQQGAM
jgi:hypothetical protein